MNILKKFFKPKTAPIQKVYGTTGAQVSDGIPIDEWLPDLEFPKNMTEYRKMRRQDPVIGGALEHLELIFPRLKRHLTGDSQNAIDFVEQIFKLIKIDQFIYSLTSIFTYGFFIGERVYKGKILVDIIPISPVSVYQINIPENLVMQVTVNGTFEIPFTKCFHFAINSHFRNPFGVSLLRKCYKPYFYKLSVEASEAVSVRYDLRGIPVITGPAGLDVSAADPANKQTYDPAVAKTLNWVNTVLRAVSNAKLFGVFMPDGFNFELKRPTGKASIDTTKIINRYNTEMLTGLLQGFLAGGMFASTNNANIKDQIQVFLLACNAYAGLFAQAINEQIIKPVCLLNGIKLKDIPTFSFGPATLSDLKDLASFVARLVAQGVITPTTELEQALLDMADLPLGKNEKDIVVNKKK